MIKTTAAIQFNQGHKAAVLVAEPGGPTMFARIGIMGALNRGHVPEFDTSHKGTHWGRRKLKRDL
jgi:hypothetical protein